MTTRTLDQLRPGDTGSVASLSGSDNLTQRLLELGVLEGESLEVLAVAPLGDPLEVRIGDTRLSLRLREAARVVVELPSEPAA